MSWRAAGLLGIVLVFATLFARVVQDPDTGTATWDASRAAGFASYLLLWLSVVVGVGLHMRFKPLGFALARALELHRITSALALSFLVAHVLAIIVDPVVDFSWVDGFVPFTSSWRPFEVGIGTIGQWMLVLVLASTALAGNMPYSTWKKLHYLSFPAYLLALVHGLMSGSDTSQFPAVMLYAMTASTVAFLLVLRVAGRDWAKADERALPTAQRPMRVSAGAASAAPEPGNAWSTLQHRLFGDEPERD